MIDSGQLGSGLVRPVSPALRPVPVASGAFAESLAQAGPLEPPLAALRSSLPFVGGPGCQRRMKRIGRIWERSYGYPFEWLPFSFDWVLMREFPTGPSVGREWPAEGQGQGIEIIEDQAGIVVH